MEQGLLPTLLSDDEAAAGSKSDLSCQASQKTPPSQNSRCFGDDAFGNLAAPLSLEDEQAALLLGSTNAEAADLSMSCMEGGPGDAFGKSSDADEYEDEDLMQDVVEVNGDGSHELVEKFPLGSLLWSGGFKY